MNITIAFENTHVVRRLLILQLCEAQYLDNCEFKHVYGMLQFESRYDWTGTVGTLK